MPHQGTGFSTGCYTRKKHPGRTPLPDHLPRKHIDYHPVKSELTCRDCGGEKSPIGEEISEQLEYIPASMFVLQHVRHKYACKSCSGNVCIAKVPSKAMDRGLPGYGLLAHVAVSKYADHLPLHRLEGIFRRHRVALARSTMCGWIATVADLLSPIVTDTFATYSNAWRVIRRHKSIQSYPDTGHTCRCRKVIANPQTQKPAGRH